MQPMFGDVRQGGRGWRTRRLGHPDYRVHSVPWTAARDGTSHFLKAFKEYTGVTPRAYAAAFDHGFIYIPD
jgi:hypothetical protein